MECTVTVVYVCNAYIYIHADYMYNVWLYMYVQHVLCIMYIRTHMYRVMKLSVQSYKTFKSPNRAEQLHVVQLMSYTKYK